MLLVFLPSPLAGEGPGVRGSGARKSARMAPVDSTGAKTAQQENHAALSPTRRPKIQATFGRPKPSLTKVVGTLRVPSPVKRETRPAIQVGWVKRSAAHADIRRNHDRVGLALLDPPYTAPCAVGRLIENAFGYRERSSSMRQRTPIAEGLSPMTTMRGDT